MANVDLRPLTSYAMRPENRGFIARLAKEDDPNVILDRLPEDVKKYLSTLEGASREDLRRALDTYKYLLSMAGVNADNAAGKLYNVVQAQAQRNRVSNQQRSATGMQTSPTIQQTAPAKKSAPATTPTSATQSEQSQSGSPIPALLSNLMAVAAPLAPVVAPYFAKLLGLDQSKGGTPGLLTQAFLRNVPGFGLPATSSQTEKPLDTTTSGQRYGLGEQTVSKAQSPVPAQRSTEG